MIWFVLGGMIIGGTVGMVGCVGLLIYLDKRNGG